MGDYKITHEWYYGVIMGLPGQSIYYRFRLLFALLSPIVKTSIYMVNLADAFSSFISFKSVMPLIRALVSSKRHPQLIMYGML